MLTPTITWANALQEQGKLEEAIEAYNKALAIKPDYAEVYSNIGNILKEQGELEAAVEAYNKSLAIKPHDALVHKNLSFALLNNGRLSEGLDEYEWRWKTAEFLRSRRLFSQPLWDGKASLKGKRILVWCEQGVGDTCKVVLSALSFSLSGWTLYFGMPRKTNSFAITVLSKC